MEKTREPIRRILDGAVVDHESMKALRKPIARLAAGVVKDREYTRRMIELHGHVILKKWTKKRKTRRTLLLKDFSSFLDIGIQSVKRESITGNQAVSYVGLYLNLEVLSNDPWKLISLLYNRSFFHPWQWVQLDSCAFKLAYRDIRSKGDKPAYGCFSTTEKPFGKWQECRSDEVERGDAYGTVTGALLQKLQSYLYEFLRKMVDVILETIDSTKGPAGQDGIATSCVWICGDEINSAGQTEWLRYLESKQYENPRATQSDPCMRSYFSSPLGTSA